MILALISRVALALDADLRILAPRRGLLLSGTCLADRIPIEQVTCARRVPPAHLPASGWICETRVVATDTTHPSLLARVRDPADAAAWREFEARYRDLIRRYCRRRELQTADAEDVSQLVLLALARALQRFTFDPARGRFRDYLGRVVNNAIQRHLSRPIQAPRLLDTSVLDLLATPQNETPDEHWEVEWMQHHLRLAMRAVRADCAPESMAVFELLLSGQSVEAVAEQSRMTPDAVYKVKQRMRERLRERTEQQIRDEEFPSPGS